MLASKCWSPELCYACWCQLLAVYCPLVFTKASVSYTPAYFSINLRNFVQSIHAQNTQFVFVNQRTYFTLGMFATQNDTVIITEKVSGYV